MFVISSPIRQQDHPPKDFFPLIRPGVSKKKKFSIRITAAVVNGKMNRFYYGTFVDC